MQTAKGKEIAVVPEKGVGNYLTIPILIFFFTLSSLVGGSSLLCLNL